MVPSYETTKTTTLAISLDAAGGTGSINFRFLMSGTQISGTLLSITSKLSWAWNSRGILLSTDFTSGMLAFLRN
jgi:hypothetical protein